MSLDLVELPDFREGKICSIIDGVAVEEEETREESKVKKNYIQKKGDLGFRLVLEAFRNFKLKNIRKLIPIKIQFST